MTLSWVLKGGRGRDWAIYDNGFGSAGTEVKVLK